MRKVRKLSLSRETLGRLQLTELRVVGGTSYTPETCGVCSGGCTGPYQCSVTDCSYVCLVNNGCDTGGNTQCC